MGEERGRKERSNIENPKSMIFWEQSGLWQAPHLGLRRFEDHEGRNTKQNFWLKMVCKNVNFESWVIKISENCKRSHLWQLRVRLRYKFCLEKENTQKPSMLHPMFNSKFKTERLKILHRCTMWIHA
jgi:hypothetical protein